MSDVLEPTAAVDAPPPALRWPSSIEYEFVRNESSSELVVVVSSGLKIHKFLAADERNVLYVADPQILFFLKAFNPLCIVIGELIAHYAFTKTIFVGGSKAGYAALILTALCAKRNREHQFRCLAVSPHTQLYPQTLKMRRFWSYRYIMRKAQIMPQITVLLEKFGDAKVVEGIDNAQVLIVYGELHKIDKQQAERLVSFNIQKMPLPVAFHSTLSLLMIRDAPKRVQDRVAARIFELMMEDKEGRQSLPPTAAELARQLEKMVWIPSLKRLVSQMMAA